MHSNVHCSIIYNKTKKQPKCPQHYINIIYKIYINIYTKKIYIYTHTHARAHTHTHIHNGILFSHENNEITLFSATWMQPEITILSEVSQTNQITCYHLYLESEKRDTNELVYKTHHHKKQTYGYLRGKV